MRAVFYLMSGAAHTPYLAVSLRTLRQHWDGDVVVFAWEESHDIVQQMAMDDRLNIFVAERIPPYRGKNDQFLDKMLVAQSMEDEYDSVLYLDADTTIHGSLDPLFDAAELHGFAATQWNDWDTCSGVVKGRLESLGEFLTIPVSLINRATAERWPSVNGGVWACRPSSPVLPLWHEWTMACTVPKHTFIADEKVLHLLQIRFTPSGDFTVLRGGRWNSSPVVKYQARGLRDEDVIVRHYHGDACCRLNKHGCDKGVRLWWPLFQECLRENVGGMREWIDRCGNKKLAGLRRSMGDETLVGRT